MKYPRPKFTREDHYAAASMIARLKRDAYKLSSLIFSKYYGGSPETKAMWRVIKAIKNLQDRMDLAASREVHINWLSTVPRIEDFLPNQQGETESCTSRPVGVIGHEH